MIASAPCLFCSRVSPGQVSTQLKSPPAEKDGPLAAITTTRAGFTSHNQWVTLANLYFARHQYDMALRTLLSYKQRAAELQAPPERRSFPAPEVENFIERLRVLGVTEDTLPQVR